VGLQADTLKIAPDVALVQFSGTLTYRETEVLESLLRVLLERGETKIIFELGGVGQIDSMGAVILVRCSFVARRNGGELRFGGRPGCSPPLQKQERGYAAPFR
jgi:anti-anti-sigma regulatory factor